MFSPKNTFTPKNPFSQKKSFHQKRHVQMGPKKSEKIKINTKFLTKTVISLVPTSRIFKPFPEIYCLETK